MIIDNLRFEQTCFACPEQYNVFDENNKQVGYVRLRWGNLYCDYPHHNGETIYEHSFNDGYLGIFESEEDREHHLTNIAKEINKKLCLQQK